MKAIHFISRRDGDIGLVGLSNLGSGHFRSECWAFAGTDDAHELIGGWIYLHPGGKDQPSRFGGKITEVQACPRSGGRDGVAFVFEVCKEGRDQLWRGPRHAMAYTSGIIDVSLPHERD